LEEVTQLKQKLNLDSIREILRQKENVYQELQLDHADESSLQATLLATPQLLERPIIVMQNGAVVARPLERLIQWLENTSDKA
jgi:putative thioredoxin